MKSYKPSNKVPAKGWVWLIVLSTCGGVAVGGIIAFISRAIYLLLIFPALMGFTSFGCTAIAVKQGKVRNPVISLFFAALTGFITYGAMHGGEYLFAKQKFSTQIQAELGQDMSDEETTALMNTFLEAETGSTDFWGYLKYSAQQGVSIGSGDGITLNEPLTWIYWLIELAIIEILSIALVQALANDPFCEICNQWYHPGQRIGTVEGDQSEVFLNAVQQDQITQAAANINPKQAATVPHLEVDLRHCPSCDQGEVILQVHRYSENKKGESERSRQLLGMMSHQQSLELKEAITPSPASAPETDTPHEGQS